MALDVQALMADPEFQALSPEGQGKLLSKIHERLGQPETADPGARAQLPGATIEQTPTGFERVGRAIGKLPGRLGERAKAAGAGIMSATPTDPFRGVGAVAGEALGAVGDITSALVGTPVSAALEGLGAPTDIANLAGFGAEVAVPLPGGRGVMSGVDQLRGIARKLPHMIEKVMPAKIANKVFGQRVVEILDDYVPFERLPTNASVGRIVMNSADESFKAARDAKNQLYDYANSLAPAEVKIDAPEISEAVQFVQKNVEDRLGIGVGKTKQVVSGLSRKLKPGEEAIPTSVGLVDAQGNLIGPNLDVLGKEGAQFTYGELTEGLKGIHEAMRTAGSDVDKMLLSRLHEVIQGKMKDIVRVDPRFSAANEALRAADMHYKTAFVPYFGMNSEYKAMSAGDATQIVQKLYSEAKKTPAQLNDVFVMLGGNLQAERQLAGAMFREMATRAGSEQGGRLLNWGKVANEWYSLDPSVKRMIAGKEHDKVGKILERVNKQVQGVSGPSFTKAIATGATTGWLTGNPALGLAVSSATYGFGAFSKMLANPYNVRLLDRATRPGLNAAESARLMWTINQTLHDLANEE